MSINNTETGLEKVHLSPEEQVKQELEKNGITDVVIKEMQEFMLLQTEAFINEEGVLVEQKEMTKAVREARIKVKNTRVAVEKKCKSLRDGANEYIKANRAAELHILKLLEPLEKHLQEQEDIPARLKQQIEDKKEREAQERYTSRLNKLSGFQLNKHFGQNFAKVGNTELAMSDIKYQSDEWFAGQIALIEAEANEEADRVAAEKAKAEEEARQLAEQKRQQEAEAQRLADEQRKLAEEKEKILAERKAIRIEKLKSAGVPENQISWYVFEQMTDLEFEGKLAEIAAAQKQLQEERLKKEQAEAEEKRLAEEKRQAELAAKREARKPDKQKLELVAKVIEGLPLPAVKTQEADQLLHDVRERLEDIGKHIRKSIENY